MSFDVRGGYLHMYLNPEMVMFLFRYGFRYYRWISLPLVCGSCTLCFTNIIIPVVYHIHGTLYFLVLLYIDYVILLFFLPERTASAWELARSLVKIVGLLERLSIFRHPYKVLFNVTQTVYHLGKHFYTSAMKFLMVSTCIRLRWNFSSSSKICHVSGRSQRSYSC